MDLYEHWRHNSATPRELRETCEKLTAERDGYQAGLRNLEVQNESLRQQLEGAVALIRRFAEHDLPGNPPNALLDLFIAAEDFIREHDHPGGAVGP